MSFDIHWDKLDSEVAKKVQDALNSHFRSAIDKPSFIGDIEITDFSFGTVAPQVEITDITDPFAEFYLPDEEVFSENDSSVAGDFLYYSEVYEDEVKQDTDAQMHVEMKYEGDMRMTVATELRMNYPSSMFMSLPVRLSITGFSFHATAVIAYLQRRINFCFLEPKTPNESLLKDVHIESEVGNKEKQVLKNVGKVERFIVDQLRNVIDEEFVFPSYFSIESD